MEIDDDEELAFIAGLNEGDVVQHPRTDEWMLITEIESGVVTHDEFAHGQTVKEDTEPYRRVYLQEIDAPEYATPLRDRLYYNDIEQQIVRKKRRPGE